MVKLTFCLRRRADLSLAEFQTYWRETHAALVRQQAAALGIKRYVQVHTIDSPMNDALRASRGAPEGYDGVAEVWWDSIEDLIAGTATDEGRRSAEALLEDEQKFIDLANSPLWLGEEHEVI